MWDRYLNRGAVSATLTTLALFVACNAQETDFVDDVPASGGSGTSKGGSAGSAGTSSTGGSGGSSSVGGASADGGTGSGGDAGSRATGGDAGTGSGGDAGGDAGGRGGEAGSASGGFAGEGGAAGGQGGEGGRDGRGGDGQGSGGDGSGGEAGSGGSDFACETSVGTPAQPVVSDLESGQLSAVAPYAGAWEPFFSGGNAVLSIVSDGADATDHALRLSGSNSTFAGFAIGLNDDGEHACPHNAAAFDGVRFFYKSTDPLTFQLTSRATVPPPSGACSGACNNHHQKTFPPAAHFTEVVLRYSELEQTFGAVSPIVRNELLSIQFVLSGVVNIGGGGGSIVGAFEADVDELEFFAD